MSTTPAPNEVSIILAADSFRHWESVELTQWLDAFSTVSLTAPFDPSSFVHRELFRPLAYHPIEVMVGTRRLFRGVTINSLPTSEVDGVTVTLEGYAPPGVLGRCGIPADRLPAEFKNATLETIIRIVAGYFGLGVEYNAPRTPAFEKVSIDIDKQPLAFLIELAQQHGVVLTSNESGDIVCQQSVAAGFPVARLEESQTVKVEPHIDGDSVFTEVTGFSKQTRKKRGGKHTERSPFAPRGVTRPLNFKLDDAERGDAVTATRAKVARMYANLAGYDITGLPSWFGPGGDIWRPNETIVLKAPSAMVYDNYEFLIRGVKLFADANGTTASLNVVLPGAFSGEIPSRMPWEE